MEEVIAEFDPQRYDHWSELYRYYLSGSVDGRVIDEKLNERETKDFQHAHIILTETIFPNNAFRCRVMPASDVKKIPPGIHYKHTLKYVEYRVAVGPPTASNIDIDNNTPHCKIFLKAPGSKKRSSDVDTTIYVEGAEALLGVGKAALLEILVPNVERRNSFLALPAIDFNRLVEARFIDCFYTRRLEEVHMSSAFYYDSNIYSSGFLLGYPAFSDPIKDPANLALALNNPRNPNSYEPKEFLDQLQESTYIKKFYADYKVQKHQFELAASVISLREGMSADEWTHFNVLLTSPQSEVISNLIDDHNLQERQKVAQYFQVVLGLAEELYTRYLDVTNPDSEFSQMCNELAQQGYLDDSVIVNDFLQEEDLKVSAKDRLYVRKLYDIAHLKSQLLDIEGKLNTLPLVYFQKYHGRETYASIIANLEDQLAKDDTNAVLISEHQEKIRKNAGLTEELDQLKADIIGLLKQRASLLIDLQRAQVVANLFANEAYINRSAVAHVIARQSDAQIALSTHTIICSALQQIGFMLLHTKNWLTVRENIPPADGEPISIQEKVGELAWRTGKYLARVGDLVFGQMQIPYTPEQLRNIQRGKKVQVQGSTVNILRELKTDSILAPQISIHNFALINLGIALAKVKDRVSDQDRAVAAYTCVVQYMNQIGINDVNPQQVYNFFAQGLEHQLIDLAINITLICINVRLEYKLGTLWGQNTIIRQSNDSPLLTASAPAPAPAPAPVPTASQSDRQFSSGKRSAVAPASKSGLVRHFGAATATDGGTVEIEDDIDAGANAETTVDTLHAGGQGSRATAKATVSHVKK